jgi:hypothetical protein
VEKIRSSDELGSAIRMRLRRIRSQEVDDADSRRQLGGGAKYKNYAVSEKIIICGKQSIQQGSILNTRQKNDSFIKQ